jgi:hypothetical protein
MNTNSTTPRPCAGCSRDLGYVMHTLSVTYDGWRYEVCGHSNGCADRLMQRLTSSCSVVMDEVRAADLAEKQIDLFGDKKL